MIRTWPPEKLRATAGRWLAQVPVRFDMRAARTSGVRTGNPAMASAPATVVAVLGPSGLEPGGDAPLLQLVVSPRDPMTPVARRSAAISVRQQAAAATM